MSSEAAGPRAQRRARQWGWQTVLIMLVPWLLAPVTALCAQDGGTELERQVAQAGHARVLVALAVAHEPESSLAQAAVGRQRADIGRAQAAVRGAAEAAGGRLVAAYQSIPFMAMEVGQAALDALRRDPRVSAVSPDLRVEPVLASSNTVIASSVPWSASLAGAGQVIAILDTGVEKDHPYFGSGAGNKVVAEACYSTNSAPDSLSSVCPDGVSASTAEGSGSYCEFNTQVCWHGTHVAGIAAGHDPAGATDGVARDAELVAMQIFSWNSATNGLSGLSSDLLSALERVLFLRTEEGLNLSAANMSLGGGLFSLPCTSANYPEYAALFDAFEAIAANLIGAGVAPVAATGNNSNRTAIAFPACVPGFISVGSTTDLDAVSAFSNLSSFTDLVAPGNAVTSAYSAGGELTLSGTSMATPHVAGAIAVLKQADPRASVADLLSLLRDTAVVVADTRTGGLETDLRRIDFRARFPADYGDAQGSYEIDPQYSLWNPAFHLNSAELYLGSSPPSTEPRPIPAAQANTDSLDDAIDGTSLVVNVPAAAAAVDVHGVHNGSSDDAQLACWADFNQDGDFLDPGERTQPGFASHALFGSGACTATGITDTSFTTGNVPAGCGGSVRVQWSGVDVSQLQLGVATVLLVRCRLTTDAGTTGNADFFSDTSPQPMGGAVNGEVEDGAISVTPTLASIGSVTLTAHRLPELLQLLLAEGTAEAMLSGYAPQQAAALDGDAALATALIPYLDPDGDGQVAVLRWQTLTERGTIGFYVERKDEAETWVKLNHGNMLPAVMPAPMGGDYQLVDPKAKSGRDYLYRLIEQEAWGSQREHGPYPLSLPEKGAGL
ncbi:S8 family peptidase [Thiocapsa sp.]|uniref:S8 family peptidase n=1 Tax=Thiocapsa sp. TaxID=2024551 RepID=UPI002D7EE103|nr:S8 family serine peptidase [Thiocapsa sp.]